MFLLYQTLVFGTPFGTIELMKTAKDQIKAALILSISVMMIVAFIYLLWVRLSCFKR